MTLMLASVADAAEAEIALIEGADIIDLKDPAQAPLGSLDHATLRAAVATVAGRRPVSAVTGNLELRAASIVAAAEKLVAAGVDYVKIGFFPGEAAEASIEALRPVAANVNLVAVIFADLPHDFSILARLCAAGFKGAMLDTANKGRLRLIDHVDIAGLKTFVDLCHDAKLLAGLAGSLEAPDVARLLPLGANILGFRSALCGAHERTKRIDAAQVKLVRELIPREAGKSDFSNEANVDWRLLSARGYSLDAEQKRDTDCVFVHDFVLPVSIGAYDFERNRTQRVRFNVDVEVRRASHHAEDMRDVFSYDLVIDAIKLILSRGHIDLVETLAERIADTLLAHPRVHSLSVRVEKLDVVEGSVGVEVTRERQARSGKLRQLFSELSDLAPTGES
jgi:(5-formylfuran-3-yl)methyl phosphate synthase